MPDLVRYTTEELQAMRAQGLDQTDWAAVLAMTDEEIEALIAAEGATISTKSEDTPHAPPHP